MSHGIHDRDPRFEHGRSLAAEQQAIRVHRAQQPIQDLQGPQSQMAPPPDPGQVQQISREGLIGSKRLAENLEGMLRDKPKFFIPETPGDSSEQAGESGSAGSESLPVFEFTPFVPGQPAPELPPGQAKKQRRASQDENSPDLNLSPENRERALTQGVPSSATGKAAMEMFRQAQAEPPASQTSNSSQTPNASRTEAPAESGSSGSSGSSIEPGGASVTGSVDSSDPLLSRASTSFDRSQVATASDSLGETRGVTQNELVLHRGDETQSQALIQQELSRQSQAQDESERRADHAESSLDTARGRERQLTQQRDQLEQAKAAQRSNADETQRLVEDGQQQLSRHQDAVQRTQAAGEASLARIQQLDGQVEQNAQARDQATQDISSSQQQTQSLQNQVDSLQRQAPSAESPGNSGNSQGKGAQEKSAQRVEAAAQSQQAISSAQAQLTQAQNQEQQARRRQEQAEASLQANQRAAAQERQNLEQTRGQLEVSQQNRGAAQARAQQHKVNLQEDLDRVKELASHGQDINAQFDEIGAAKDRAISSLERNRANASAAQQNVEQLRILAKNEADEQAAQTANGNTSSETTVEQRPSVTVSQGESGVETLGGTSSAGFRSAPVRNEVGPTVQNQGDKTVVRLASLNQGLNATSIDTSSGASRRRSGVEGTDDLGSASLAAASAASNPTSSSASESLRDTGRGRGEDDPGKGKGPPEHSNAGGNGKGRGKS